MQMEPATIFDLVGTVGFPSALVAFFVWIGWKREMRLADRVTHLEETQRDELLSTVRNNTEAITALKTCIKGVKEDAKVTRDNVVKLTENLDNRPCAAAQDKIQKAIAELAKAQKDDNAQ